ncbi:MAG: CorA family divalent cation transporter, partial [Sphaerochaetaceae bacterium]
FMFPTFIVSFWGMNIKLPFMQLKWAWVLMVAICAIAALVGILFLSDWQNARLIAMATEGKPNKKRKQGRKNEDEQREG